MWPTKPGGSKLNIRLRGIKKSFEDNVVLNGVDLEVQSGEIVALAGENGAGKSTLMKIISGALSPDSGQMFIDNKPVTFHRVQDAMGYRIRMIYQELNLIRDLSVAENLYLVDEDHQYGNLIVKKRKMVDDAKTFLKKIGLDMDPRVTVRQLNIAEQQMVEISKSLVKEVKLLIMDEPTAALNREESERLFEQIRKLKQQGISIIYISHRLEEITSIADRVVILRDGQVVLADAIHNVTQSQLVTAMVGQQLENFYPKEHNARLDEIKFQVIGLTKEPFFEDVSFAIKNGEVLGVAGLMGSGKSEMLRCLFGDMKLGRGEIHLEGKKIRIRRPIDAIKQGLVFLTADRKQEGLFMDMSVFDNLSLSTLGKFIRFVGIINRRKEQRVTADLSSRLRVKARSERMAVRHLSGGNQQKVVLGKWIMTEPKIFMMEEPTRGVDVGAKSEIYRLMNELTKQGISILLVSSDVPELVAMSDRVIVMREGRIIKELDEESITQHDILHYSLRGAVQ